MPIVILIVGLQAVSVVLAMGAAMPLGAYESTHLYPSGLLQISPRRPSPARCPTEAANREISAAVRNHLSMRAGADSRR